EDRDVVARHGADLSSGIQPADFEAECIAVMPLRPLHVVNGELRRGMSERRPRCLRVHGNLPRVLRCITIMFANTTCQKPRSVQASANRCSSSLSQSARECRVLQPIEKASSNRECTLDSPNRCTCGTATSSLVPGTR